MLSNMVVKDDWSWLQADLDNASSFGLVFCELCCKTRLVLPDGS